MLVATIVVLVVFAAAMLLSGLRQKQIDGAVGVLSREEEARATASSVLGSAEELTGKQVERAAALERKAESNELVV